MPVLDDGYCKWAIAGYDTGRVGFGTQYQDAERCEVCGRDGGIGHLLEPAFARKLAAALLAAADEAEAQS